MVAQDTFISDEEEDLCPLCFEEMDMSDKNFRPCPCGYQICQFCYNNIRQNPDLNGLCPACRRPYDDESVEYTHVTAEDLRRERQARKEKERKQRDREKRDTEQQTGPASKKHLAGMRVIQKNLVYVIGLNPNIPTDQLHAALRQEQFFGQYGKIQKIVINKRTNAHGNPGIGVYVTFARKEDAARCIAAVDGSMNDGKYLRAAYGTTKYCSAYLRGATCQNPNCMFLHEPGEEADSYTRRDLSAMHHRQNNPPPSGSGPSYPGLGTGFPNPPPSHGGPGGHGGSHSAHAAGHVGQSAPAAPSAPAVNPPLIPQQLPSLPSHGSHTNVAAAPPPVSGAWGKPAVSSVSSVAAAAAAASAAAAAALPARPQPLHTPAQTPVPEDAPEPASAVRSLNQCLEALAKGPLNFSFSSTLLSADELAKPSMPPLFTFSLSADARKAAYDDASRELEKYIGLLDPRDEQDPSDDPSRSQSRAASVASAPSAPSNPASVAGTPQGTPRGNQQGLYPQQPQPQQTSQQPPQQPQPQPQPQDGSPRSVSLSPSPAASTPPPGLFVQPQTASSAQNSHELLNHLLKGKSGSSTPSQSVY